MAVGIGDKAPDFDLEGTGGSRYSLSQFRGKPVVVVFYPADDSPVCTRQLNSYNDDLEAFNAVGAQVLAISSQDMGSHEQFASRHGLKFPLLADTNKKVAEAYGTVGPLGFPRRSVFVVDAEGMITYAHRAIAGLTFRPVEELIQAIAKA